MPRLKIAIAATLAALSLSALAAPAGARMKSTKVDGVCLTQGGGKFVGIPGFPGERIDRRLLRDVRFLVRNYAIFVTDGFSTSSIHSANGEHPVGLALDIVPNRAAGGTWGQIDALADWAEPRQNSTIAPFRWVGYNGDQNHGRGHHLHLSWSHSPAKFGKPAKSVYTLRCPKRRGARAEGSGKDDKPKPETPDKPNKPAPPNGGTESGKPDPAESSGGVGQRLAPVVAERSGAER